MNRSTFKRKTYERTRTVHTPIPEHLRRKATMAKADEAHTKVEKENLLQHAGYINLVRSMPCAHCGAAPRSQFCHSDETKGTGIKSDCRNGWPGCAECHYKIGTKRIYPKEQRRELEADMARKTREQIIQSGQWPKSLPKLENTTDDRPSVRSI